MPLKRSEFGSCVTCNNGCGSSAMYEVDHLSDKAYLLGFPVDLVDMRGALDLAEEFLRSGRSHRLVTLNPEMIMLSRRNPELKKALSGADAYLPDTAGMAWALGIEKIAGIDFMYKLLKLAAGGGYSVYFLGAKPGVAEKAAAMVRAAYLDLRVAGTHHGYFSLGEEEGLVAGIVAANPDILLVAMGTVPQETFIDRHEDELGARLIMGVGGSFDVLAGEVIRAPESFRRHNLEWLYRLLTQPRRFWRIASTLPLFVLLVIWGRVRRKNDKVLSNKPGES